MPKDNMSYLPIWKEGATAEERFFELSMMARKNPERFKKVVVVFEETRPNGCTVLRYMSDHLTTNELLGIFVVAQTKVLEDTRGNG